jgi:hypothetical protein
MILVVVGTRVRESRSRSGIPTLDPDRKHSRLSKASNKKVGLKDFGLKNFEIVQNSSY